MKCPYCAEEIQPDAKKCRFCNEWLRESPPSDSSQSPEVVAVSPPSASPQVKRPANCPHCGFSAKTGEHFCGRCGKILAVAKPLQVAPPSTQSSSTPLPSTQRLPRQEQIPIALPVQENTSGRGNDSVLPQELRRFNWGAFLLGWLWSIVHRQWIGLLCLVPGFGIVMWFVLGFKGNEWAWRSQRWESADRFAQVQLRWRQAGFACMLFGILASGYIQLAVMTSTSQNNLKVLSGAVKSYQSEHGGVFPPFEKDIRGDLAPYLAQVGATDDVYQQPNVGSLYDSNEELSGRSESEVPSPSTTILFNEDQGDIFGKRSVIFADGHVEHVSSSQWESIKNASTLPPRKPKLEPEMDGTGEESASAPDEGSPTNRKVTPAFDVPSLIGLNYEQVVGVLGQPDGKLGQLPQWDKGASLVAIVEADGSTIKGFILPSPIGMTSDVAYLLALGNLRQDDERYSAELQTDTKKNETRVDHRAATVRAIRQLTTMSNTLIFMSTMRSSKSTGVFLLHNLRHFTRFTNVSAIPRTSGFRTLCPKKLEDAKGRLGHRRGNDWSMRAFCT